MLKPRRSISTAEIDDDVEIGPFCVVGPHARIKSGTRLLNSVTIMGHVTIGHDNVIYPNVVIGGEPQDISYAGSDTQVVIGDGNIDPRRRDDQSRQRKRRRHHAASATRTS